jgi:hypothetical protein
LNPAAILPGSTFNSIFVHDKSPVRDGTPWAGRVFRCVIGLLRLLAPDRLPLVEAVPWQDAAPAVIGFPKRRRPLDGLAFGVDRLAAAFRALPLRSVATIKERVRRSVVSEPQRLSCQPFRLRAPTHLWSRQNAGSSI